MEDAQAELSAKLEKTKQFLSMRTLLTKNNPDPDPNPSPNPDPNPYPYPNPNQVPSSPRRTSSSGSCASSSRRTASRPPAMTESELRERPPRPYRGTRPDGPRSQLAFSSLQLGHRVALITARPYYRLYYPLIT